MNAIGDTSSWTPHMKYIFREMEPAALYVAGPIELVPRRMGDNRGGRPLRLGVTKQWLDQITPQIDKGGYICKMCVHFRVWSHSEKHISLLIEALMKMWSGTYDNLRHPWIDAGPEYTPEMLERAIIATRTDIGFDVWSEPEFEELIQRKSRQAMDQTNTRKRRLIA